MRSKVMYFSSTMRGSVLRGAIALVILAGVVFLGIYGRAKSGTELKKWTDAQSLPVVSLIRPLSPDALDGMELPGRFEPYIHAPIYARVNGYLRRWYADIGSHVSRGQLLAEIDTPDLDQQILQARADLANAEANLTLATTTATRWKAMLGSESVSRQEVDEKSGDLASRQAQVNAAKASLNRLMSTKAFARVTSPFDGVVTARNTDNGALIAEGTSGKALFEVSDNKRLRLYVNVPQYAANAIAKGDQAELRVPEHPNQTFTAVVETSSRAIDTLSGSTLLQLMIDNRSGDLLAGGYATVHFKGKAGSGPQLTIPSSALIFDQDGLHVATVNAQHQVLLKPVTIRRDSGKTIELASGLEAHDLIIEIPPDGLADGDRVRVAEAK